MQIFLITSSNTPPLFAPYVDLDGQFIEKTAGCPALFLRKLDSDGPASHNFQPQNPSAESSRGAMLYIKFFLYNVLTRRQAISELDI
ncbi:hypothetical protein [Hymenobacter ruber]